MTGSPFGRQENFLQYQHESTMRTTLFRSIGAVLIPVFLLFVLSGCDSNDPEGTGAGDQEVISNVTLTFDDPATQATDDVVVEAVYNEAEVLQSIDPIQLTSGTTYSVSVDLQDRFNGEDITEEVSEEDDVHRFFYRVEDAQDGNGDPVSNVIAVSGLDTDANGDPLGLTFTAEAQSATTSQVFFRVKLRHYEDDAQLPADKRSDTIEADEVSGVVETDIDLFFPLTVQ